MGKTESCNNPLIFPFDIAYRNKRTVHEENLNTHKAGKLVLLAGVIHKIWSGFTSRKKKRVLLYGSLTEVLHVKVL